VIFAFGKRYRFKLSGDILAAPKLWRKTASSFAVTGNTL
jgi:hypothetical protein